MKKRIFSIALALCLVFGSLAVAAQATDEAVLRFDKNGEFKILHLCDCQDEFPAIETMITYINHVLKVYEPDIVVLGGDNTTGPEETKKEAIAELVAPFVENEVYFTLVFGNHDREQGVDNDTLLTYYQEAGGKYCLAYDPIPELHGSATHNLPVYASDGSDKVNFNLYMFDSGSGVYDEQGNGLGYDCVTEDQIDWYVDVSEKLAEENGGLVPSMAFQHIVVGDVYDALFPEVNFSLDPLTQSYNGKNYLIICPRTDNFEGHLFEPPCPGYYNYGQFDTMAMRGDVLAIYSGHDHVNSYETELYGVKIINTPGATYNSYGNEIVRGSRLITVNENDPDAFTTEVITVNDFAVENEEFANASGISPIVGKIWNIIGEVLLALSKASAVISKIIY